MWVDRYHVPPFRGWMNFSKSYYLKAVHCDITVVCLSWKSSRGFEKSGIHNNNMSLGVAILIHLLLLVDRAYTKKGEFSFFILMEHCLDLIGVFHIARAIYTDKAGPSLFKVIL